MVLKGSNLAQFTGEKWRNQIVFISLSLLGAGISISVSLVVFFKYLLFTVFLFTIRGMKIKPYFRDPLFLLVSLYSLFAITSCFTSVIFESSTGHLQTFIENYLVFFVGYSLSAENRIEERSLVRIILIMAVFFVLQMAYIIFAHLTKINLVSLNGWIYLAPSDYFGRQSGTFDYPAFNAALFCLITPMFYYLWKKLNWKMSIKRMVISGMVIISLLGLYYIRSTGAAAGLFAGIFFFLTIKLMQKIGVTKGWIISGILAVLMAVVLVFSFSSLPEKTRKGLIYRYEMARGSYDLGYYRPLFGSGPNTFHLQYKGLVKSYPEKYSYFSERWHHAHNTVMNTLAESGFPAAFTLFFFWIVLIIKSAIRFYRENHTESILLSVSLLMILIYSLSDEILNMKPGATLFWMIAGIFIPLCFRPSSQKQSQKKE